MILPALLLLSLSPLHAQDLAAAPEFQALEAKEDAELAALEKKNDAELLAKAKDPKFQNAEGKKKLQALIKKQAAAEGKLAAKEVREEEAYLLQHAPKAEAAQAQEKK
jgi:hypothetical protein